MENSFQAIEDFYINRGYKGAELRRALLEDEDYQRLLKERKEKLAAKIKVSTEEKEKYVLSTDKDFEILELCKKLEGLDLNDADKATVRLIKSQLENEWREPLLEKLNELMSKYIVK